MSESMKTIIITSCLCLLTSGCTSTTDVRPPLVVQTSVDWVVDYQGENGIDFYSVTRSNGDQSLLMFSRWPPPQSKEQIPSLVNSLARGFLDQAKDNREFSLESPDYEVQNIQGEFFSGQSAVFTIDDGSLAAMFMISDGDGIWNGQFTGSKEHWVEAENILKKLKRNI